PKSHADSEGREMVGGIAIEGPAALGIGFHPAAGLCQGLSEIGAKRTTVGDQLDRPAVRGKRLIDLASGEQGHAEGLMDRGAFRLQRQGGTVVASRFRIPFYVEQRGAHLAIELEVVRAAATRLAQKPATLAPAPREV